MTCTWHLNIKIKTIRVRKKNSRSYWYNVPEKKAGRQHCLNARVCWWRVVTVLAVADPGIWSLLLLLLLLLLFSAAAAAAAVLLLPLLCCCCRAAAVLLLLQQQCVTLL